MFRSLLVSLFCISQLSVVVLASRCGIPTLSRDDRAKVEKSFRSHKSAMKNGQRVTNTTVEVYFHVIAANQTRPGGYIKESMVHDQMNTLVRDFSNTGINFHLASINYTMNAEWFNKAYPGNQQAQDMIQTLRATNAANVLNIFTVGFYEPPPEQASLLGYATFPWDYQSNPKMDGVVIHAETLPNGHLRPYDQGKTATHEVGHWVGLWHTFQTDDNQSYCDRNGHGDYVSDTPLQNGPTSGCPAQRDSCPDDEGLDPIHNFMDYSDDVCLEGFSKGQIERMQEQMSVYRLR